VSNNSCESRNLKADKNEIKFSIYPKNKFNLKKIPAFAGIKK